VPCAMRVRGVKSSFCMMARPMRMATFTWAMRLTTF
jgi:hypothetical protein